MPRPSARRHLLDTAATLVVTEGPAALTYDRVAENAEVSKGGMLYHFPTKALLIEALLDDVLDGFEDTVDAAVAASAAVGDGAAGGGSSTPGAWARAYVDATFDVEVSRPDLALALLVASPEAGAELMERCARRFAAWQVRLAADGLPAATAALVRYACDGWWTLRAFAPDAAAEDAPVLRRHLHALLDGAQAVPV